MQFLLLIYINLLTQCICFNIKHKNHYKYHQNIHILDNNDYTCTLHSELVPSATKLFDQLEYNDFNIRNNMLNNYQESNSVLDLCCGLGFSTPFLKNNKYSIGVDINKQIINKANKIWNYKKKFIIDNAETFYSPIKFDIVTIFFAFNEIPQHSRKKIINNAFNHASKSIIIIDISPNYKPSQLMLYDEPYIEEYLKNINNDLRNFDEYILIQDKVNLWRYDI